MRRTLLIEGVPYAFGEALPDWSDHTLADGMVVERPEIVRTLDAMGGVAVADHLSFSLLDADLLLSKLVKLYEESPGYIVSPSVLTHYSAYSDGVTFDHDNHLTHKPFFADGAYPTISGKQLDNMVGDTWSFCTHVYDIGAADNYYIKRGDVFIWQSGNNIEVGGKISGFSTYVSSSGLIPNTGYYHLAVVKEKTEVHIYINKVKETHALDTLDNTVDTDATIGINATSVNFANARWYTKALSNAEVLADYLGEYADELLWSYDMSPWDGYVLHDLSGNNLHANFRVSSPDWTVARPYIPGDIIYLPQGTGRITERVASTEYKIELGLWSALQYQYKQFYANVYPNEYTALFSTSAPPFWTGRLMAYYEDKVLKYAGRIENIQQNGRGWIIDTQDILQALSQGLKPVSLTLPLRDNWLVYPGGDPLIVKVEGSSDWTESYFPSAISGGYTAQGLATALDEMCNTVGPDELGFASEKGFYVRQLSVDSAEVISLQDNLKFLFDDPAKINQNTAGQWNSFQLGRRLKTYGYIFNGTSAMWIYLKGAQGNWINSIDRIKITDYEAEKTYIGHVVDYDETNGAVQIVGLYEKTDEGEQPVNYIAGESYSPVVIELYSRVAANTVEELIFSLLTSTGSSVNGLYDSLAGTLGLGLPAELVDTTFRSEFNLINGAVWDSDEGQFANDLQALGLGLTLRDGMYRIFRMRPPQIAQAIATITDNDVQPGDFAKVNWGYHRAMTSVSWKQGKHTIKINAVAPNIWEASVSRSKEFKAASTFEISNLENWGYLMAQILQWFRNYAPTLRCKKINHGLQLGDVVLVTAKKLAGWGRYGKKEIPAIVTRLQGDFGFDLILNTDPVASAAIWVPSWEIDTYSGTTITLRDAEGEQMELIKNVPAALQIIDNEGTVLEAAVTVTAVVDEDTITVSSAPTYSLSTKGILTLKNYTSENNDLRQKYTWCANTSGVMSNGDQGKRLV